MAADHADGADTAEAYADGADRRRSSTSDQACT